MLLKIFGQLSKVIFISLAALCIILYFFQEKLIFFPEKLTHDYQFRFDQPFEEKTIQTKDGYKLNALLFKADTSKGVILYLHGNAGSIDSWGEVAKTYTDLQYDLFIMDYRGYGKSEGKIRNENQLYEDVQATYDLLKKDYNENQIIVLGYSIGTGMASYLAANNSPKYLILQAPYFSLTDLVRKKFPFIPAFLLKYKLENNKRIKQCKMPVYIFHGTADEVIYYGSSKRLQILFKKEDRLISLEGVRHNDITGSTEYQDYLKKLLKD